MGDIKKDIMPRAIANMKSFRGDNKNIKNFIDNMGNDLFDMQSGHLPDYKEGLKNMDKELKLSGENISSESPEELSTAIDKIQPREIAKSFEKQPIFTSVIQKISGG